MKQVTKIKHGAINIYQKGTIKERAILFLHGNSLSGKSFEKQFESLPHLPIVAADLPGHGLSDPASVPEKTYSLPGYVEAVKKIISELNLNNFIIAGHSLGGHIAIEAAPELPGLKGLVIFGTPPLGTPPAIDKAFFPNPAIPLLFKDNLTDEELNFLASSFVLDDKNVAEDFKVQIKQTDKRARAFFGASVAQGKMKDEIGIVKKLNIPIAVLHGEKDPLINVEYIQTLFIPTLWKEKVHLVKNSGHSPQAEQPAAFNSMISDFYNSVFLN